MVVNTELNIIDYIVLVNEMVLEYFNDDGEYQPHIGMLNVMRLFYNNCVVESKFDNPHDIVDAMDMEIIVEDDDFLNTFNDALVGNIPGVRFDFANAYKDAMDIVENKKHSIERAVDSIKKLLSSIFDIVNPLLTDEHMDMVAEIAKNVGNGNISAEAIVDAYGKSKRFQQVINSKEKKNIDTATTGLVSEMKAYGVKEESINKDNIIPIDNSVKK